MVFIGIGICDVNQHICSTAEYMDHDECIEYKNTQVLDMSPRPTKQNNNNFMEYIRMQQV